MRRIKKKKTVLIVFIIIAVLVCGFLGTLYYITSTVNNYSYDEKTWINNNSNKTFDVYVEQSLPVFSSNGEGVYYDYLKALKEDSGINLNIITTDTSTLKLTNKNSTSESDIVVYKDHFVVVGRDDVNKLSDLNYKTVGVISSDIDNVTYYLTEYKNITIKTYDDFDKLNVAYEDEIVDYMVLPMYKYIDKIISYSYDIVFHLDGLYSYYCLSFNNSNEELNSIMTKFYNRWSKKAQDKVNEYFLKYKNFLYYF